MRRAADRKPLSLKHIEIPQPQEAVEYLQKVIQAEPENVGAYMVWGTVTAAYENSYLEKMFGPLFDRLYEPESTSSAPEDVRFH